MIEQNIVESQPVDRGSQEVRHKSIEAASLDSSQEVFNTQTASQNILNSQVSSNSHQSSAPVMAGSLSGQVIENPQIPCGQQLQMVQIGQQIFPQQSSGQLTINPQYVNQGGIVTHTA